MMIANDVPAPLIPLDMRGRKLLQVASESNQGNQAKDKTYKRAQTIEETEKQT